MKKLKEVHAEELKELKSLMEMKQQEVVDQEKKKLTVKFNQEIDLMNGAISRI